MTFERISGFVPNSLLSMQGKPKIVEDFEVLTQAVVDPAGEVRRVPDEIAAPR